MRFAASLCFFKSCLTVQDFVHVVESSIVTTYSSVTESSRVRIPDGKHFCLFAIQAVLPLLPAKMRKLPDEDWLEQDSLVACPDPDERLIMRIERIGRRTLRTDELT